MPKEAASRRRHADAAASKKAGRPLKTSSGDEPTEQRRARTRHAQRAFRSRQADRLHSLKREVSNLQDVVESMSKTFVGFSDSLLSSETMMLEPALSLHLKSTIECFVGLSRKAVAFEPDLEENEPAEDTSHRDEERMEKSGDSFTSESESSNFYKSQAQAPGSSSALLSSAPPFQDLAPQPSGSGYGEAFNTRITDQHFRKTLDPGSMSPRFDYGLWIGTLVPPSAPPEPYLPGRFSFATRLYWSSLAVAYQSLRSRDDMSEEFVQSFFGWKLRYAARQEITWVIAKVFSKMQQTDSEFLSQGHSPDGLLLREIDETAQYVIQSNADPEAPDVKAAITEDIVQSGGSVDDYMNAAGVERYLREKWSIDVDSLMAEPPEPASTSTYATNPVRAVPESRSIANHPASVDFDSLGSHTRPNPLLASFPDEMTTPAVAAAAAPPPYDSFSSGTRLNAQSLVDRLKFGALTIGEGPRYSVASVDAVAMDFLVEKSVFGSQ